MSEEKVAESPESNEEKVFKGLQQEFIQLTAQLGEQDYIISNATKNKAKLRIRIRKIDKKAQAMIAAQRMRLGAQQKSAPKIVPSPEELPAAS